jgi:ribonuclease PH
MSGMTAGTCTMTVSATGITLTATYGGSGMALSIIQQRGPVFLTQVNAAFAALAAAANPASPPITSLSTATIAQMQLSATNLAEDSQAQAAGIVSYVQANAVAVALINDFGSGIPSSIVDLAIT